MADTDGDGLSDGNEVNAAGGGTHTTIAAAISATNTATAAYQIIGIAPGVYKGPSNVAGLALPATKPKLLVLGLAGAAQTIIDGDSVTQGWIINNSAVISSLTFQNTFVALYVDAAGQDVRFVDLLIKKNATTYAPLALISDAAGVNVYSAREVRVVGSTFLNNEGWASGKQVYITTGAGVLTDTVVWGQTTGTMVAANATTGTLTATYCLVKGQTMAGTGNLASTVDAKLRSDAHLRSDSPLRGVGGAVLQSKTDFDGEPRPTSSAPDIGVDQFIDIDADHLPDAWEVATFGNTTSLDGAADADGDGLTNAQEHDLETDYLNRDTDHDGVDDGLEVAMGMNPRLSDSDDLVGDLNHDGLLDSISAQLGHEPNQMDDDGDGISNADEILMCTNPLRADTDGDGVPDNTDVFPFDPLMSTLPSDPLDVTAPVITLTNPWYAVLQ